MQEPEDVIIDSALSLEEALSGKEIPADVRISLRLIDVEYLSFDDRIHRGQLVVHERVAEELATLFREMKEMRFPIEKAVPVVAYEWDDEASMAANNTSAFNYRVIYGTNRLSSHSYGLAIDINPLLNPYIPLDKSVHPVGAVYDTTRPGTLTADGPVVAMFESRGWEWGGRWENRKDWQHFQKR